MLSMKSSSIRAAKLHLSRLIEQACAGEEVIITRGDTPVVRLVPIEQVPLEPAKPRVPGSMRGQVPVTDAFWEPLPPEELAAWGE
jgi:prevent-host-death family protein